MTDLRELLAFNMKFHRARLGLSQEKLAEKVGVSTRYIQSVEAGEYFPSLPTLAALRAALRPVEKVGVIEGQAGRPSAQPTARPDEAAA